MTRHVEDLIGVQTVQLCRINWATKHDPPATFHAPKIRTEGRQPVAFAPVRRKAEADELLDDVGEAGETLMVRVVREDRSAGY
jgi:hypothetical protein